MIAIKTGTRKDFDKVVSKLQKQGYNFKPSSVYPFDWFSQNTIVHANSENMLISVGDVVGKGYKLIKSL